MLGRDVRREWEQQAAFEEAERLRAEKRAAAVFDSFIDSSPVGIELYDVGGQLLRSNKAAERLLGKVPPPGISLFEERGLKRAGLLEPQLKRVLAGARVETPPTWYDPTEIGIPGMPGRKVCFRATVFPLFDAENTVTRIVVTYEDLTELVKLEESLKEATRVRDASELSPVHVGSQPTEAAADVREVEFRRRKAEQALREAEERHRAFLAGQQSYVAFELTEDGRVTEISPSVERIWGVSADTIQADPSTFLAQVHPDDQELVRDTEAGIRRSGTYPEQYRFRVQNKKTGAVHWVEVQGSVSRIAGKRCFHAIAIDITHLVAVEEALRQKTAALERLLAGIHDGLVQLDSELKVVRWSPATEKETGMPAGDTVGRLISEVYPGFEQAGFIAVLKESLAHNVSLRHEAFCSDAREQYAGWYEITTYPWDAGLLVRVRNTTRFRKTEQELAARQADLRALTSSQVDGIVVLDQNMVVTAWNNAAEKETRITAQEALGRPIVEVYPAFASAGFLAAVTKAMANKTAVRHEAFYSDGRERQVGWFSVTAYPLGQGALLRIRNTTQFKKTEQAWLLADARLKALLDMPGLAIATKDHELRYTMANPEALRMLGLGAEWAILGKTDQEILKPPVADLLTSHDRRAMQEGKAVELELVLPHALSSKAAWYRVVKGPLAALPASFDSGTSGHAGTLTVAMDITKRVHAHQELSRRKEFLEKMIREQAKVLEKTQKELERWAKT
ncbi:MAG: PAS domain-containing protein [candidate division WOR-3 bacterium]